jgi:tetratricopeptide (TPR) repeat protein
MARGILVFMLLTVSSILVAQQPLKIDTADLTYASTFERKAFADYASKKPDYFALFLAIDSTVTEEQYKIWKDRFDKTVTELNPGFSDKKKNDKKARFLYESVHKSFLSKYEELSFFNQIFRNGVYNCVTATALYSLVFDRFSIPYAIQERPTHVYLVAYPEQERIQIETTTPIGGYRIYDQAFKQQYVKKLTDYKLISASEYQSQSVDQLFDKYFFNNEVINITQLVGIQYYNAALSYIDKNEKVKALEQLEKYYFLYPDEKSRYLMFALTAEIFNSLTYGDSKKSHYLVKLCKFRREGITSDIITSEFYRITQLVFMQDGDREKYEKIYHELMDVANNAEIQQQLTYIFNYEIGRIAYNQERYTEAASYFEKALVAKPNSVDMSNLFITNLTMMRKNARDKTVFVSQVQQYGEKYPALKKDNNFFELLGSIMLESFGTAYENGSITEGEKYRLMFEDLMTKNPDASIVDIDYEIGRAYSAACVYYFKKNQRSKARTFVDKGLSLAPNNYELRSRKEMLN